MAIARMSINDPALTFDADDPEGFRAGMLRFGTQMGAADSGTSLYELPPGQALCPYHYEYGEEEWLLVIAGQPSVRTPDGVQQLQPGEIVFFPKGPDGAHQVRNDSDAAARILMWSTVVLPTATVYPDSDKIGIWTGNKQDDALMPRSAKVDYYHGETSS